VQRADADAARGDVSAANCAVQPRPRAPQPAVELRDDRAIAVARARDARAAALRVGGLRREVRAEAAVEVGARPSLLSLSLSR
jgi:hypothetical protein